MSAAITIGISDMKVGKNPDVLATYALGSCIGICLYDNIKKMGALGHIMLPESQAATESSIHKYADTCVPEMLRQLDMKGAVRRNLTAKIAGGASMFQVSGNSSISNIGQRNVDAVRYALRKYSVKLVAEDCGSNYGRTVFFYLDDGRVEVKSFSREIKVL